MLLEELTGDRIHCCVIEQTAAKNDAYCHALLWAV